MIRSRIILFVNVSTLQSQRSWMLFVIYLTCILWKYISHIHLETVAALIYSGSCCLAFWQPKKPLICFSFFSIFWSRTRTDLSLIHSSKILVQIFPLSRHIFLQYVLLRNESCLTVGTVVFYLLYSRPEINMK